MKRVLSLTLSVIMTLSVVLTTLVSCAEGGEWDGGFDNSFGGNFGGSKIDKLEIEGAETVELEVGKTHAFKTSAPDEIKNQLKWSSSNEAASVDNRGVVLAESVGMAVITVTYGKLSDTVLVKVVAGKPPHEHSFIDGDCWCGERDPNYVPPHNHSFVNGRCECGELDPNYDFDSAQRLEAAIAYVDSLYKYAYEYVYGSFERASTVQIDSETFEIIWSADNEKISIEKNFDSVTVVVPENFGEEYTFCLTATAFDANGRSLSSVFNLTVPSFKVLSFDEYRAAEEGSRVVIDGIVVGVNSKQAGNKRNHLFLLDLEGKGGYYVYNMLTDPKTLGIEIGMTVRVCGELDIYNGIYEIMDASAEIINAEKTDAAAIDLSEKFAAGADLKAYCGALVTFKDVTLGAQELGGTGDYLFFTLNGVQSYVRSYLTDLEASIKSDANKAAIEADHLAHFGYNADVTGILIYYNSTAYLIPVSLTPFTNYNSSSLSIIERIKAELDNVKLDGIITSDTNIEVPVSGETFNEVDLTWESNNSAVRYADGKLIINIPNTIVGVKITVTASVGDVSDSRTFDVILGKNLAPNSEISIRDALDLGVLYSHNTYSSSKYYVTGVISEVYNTTYGNMYIIDEHGNRLTIYGTYGADGTERYDALSYKPVSGDTVTIYGVVGQYNGIAQIKSGWITCVEVGEVPVHKHLLIDGKCECGLGYLDLINRFDNSEVGEYLFDYTAAVKISHTIYGSNADGGANIVSDGENKYFEAVKSVGSTSGNAQTWISIERTIDAPEGEALMFEAKMNVVFTNGKFGYFRFYNGRSAESGLGGTVFGSGNDRNFLLNDTTDSLVFDKQHGNIDLGVKSGEWFTLRLVLRGKTVEVYVGDGDGGFIKKGAVERTDWNNTFEECTTVVFMNDSPSTMVIGLDDIYFGPYVPGAKITDGTVQPPHEHNFVDGKCECGEEDPNYEPPHEHNFVDGKCECGETDPSYKPEDPKTPIADENGFVSFEGIDAIPAEIATAKPGALNVKESGGSNALEFVYEKSKSEAFTLYPTKSDDGATKLIIEADVTDSYGSPRFFRIYAGTTVVYDFRINGSGGLAAEGNNVWWGGGHYKVGETYNLRIEATVTDGKLDLNLYINGNLVTRPSAYGSKVDLSAANISKITKITITDNEQAGTVDLGSVFIDNYRFVKLAGDDTPAEPPHEHNFVEGKCECGETDPSYVVPVEPEKGSVITFDEDYSKYISFGVAPNFAEENTMQVVDVDGNKMLFVDKNGKDTSGTSFNGGVSVRISTTLAEENANLMVLEFDYKFENIEAVATQITVCGKNSDITSNSPLLLTFPRVMPDEWVHIRITYRVTERDSNGNPSAIEYTMSVNDGEPTVYTDIFGRNIISGSTPIPEPSEIKGARIGLNNNFLGDAYFDNVSLSLVYDDSVDITN